MSQQVGAYISPLTEDQLRAERDYLLARANTANRTRFGEELRWTGISSNALVYWVFGGRPPRQSEYPADPSDMASCYRAVRRLPAHLRERGDSMLAIYRAAFEQEGHYSLAEMDEVLANEGRA